MLQILSFKLPKPLFHKLESSAKFRGLSKGALIREAIGQYLEKDQSNEEEIARATEALLKNKKIKTGKKIDWDELRRQCSVPMDITPEEEVRLSRRRRL